MINYKLLSKVYDLLDIIYFKKMSLGNPRKVILDIIPDENVNLLDLCCGTMGNSIQIAEKRPLVQITGLDRSEEMLKLADEKVEMRNLTNVKTLTGDATDTGIAEGSMDYAILGLVLHETEEELNTRILQEIQRVLKPEGKLIVLEWELPQDFFKKILFFPIKLLEPKTFKTFVRLDKKDYFSEHGYEMEKWIHTDYSCVLVMRKNKIK